MEHIFHRCQKFSSGIRFDTIVAINAVPVPVIQAKTYRIGKRIAFNEIRLLEKSWEEIMITITNAKKYYETKDVVTPALQNVSFSVDEGEMIAVMGASGSGKSTLLNILGAMDTLTEGEYLFNDIEVSSMSAHKLHQFRKKNISFIFQNFELMNRYTVYENVELPLLARGRRKYRQQIMDMLNYVGIGDLAKKTVTQLSGGEQQRCAIARALVADTPLILADEPTGALDSGTSQEIMELLKRLNGEGKTIIIATHDYLVAEYCNRIIRLQDGKIVQSY